jgi:4-amino-4-deoxychorismate lyase
MVLVNGVSRAAVSAMDRGLTYGDGVFRTLPVRGGVTEQWQRQYAKLAHDCGVLGISCPDERVLEREVRSVCGRDADCSVRITVTRGEGERGYRYSPGSEPTRIVASTPIAQYPDAHRQEGVKVRLCRIRLAHQAALGGVKHLNRLENVLARAEWSDTDIAEGILCDGDGNVIGGTMTNLFIVVGGNLVTPELNRCGVAGVTRDRVLAIAVREGVAREVRPVALGELFSAQEIFLVNSLIGAWPVRFMEGRNWPAGTLTRSLQHWLTWENDAQVA